ncbi:MAG: hypothetical protein FJ167_06085 [Gammaproteobacteria bacterium]|nr:hypothetical protein [Gammaproteobacteria bacterium]
MDLLYQAQLARIQKEQEARLQGANMFMNLGLQLPQIVNQVEQNRIRAMQAEADQQRARAYEESLKRQRELDEQRLKNEEERVREERAARMAQYMPGGYELPMDDFQQRIAGTAVEPLFRVMPTQAVGEQAITPGETMTLGQLAQPDALGARPLGISALGGTAQMADAIPIGGYAAKLMSPDERRAMQDAQAKATAAQVKQKGTMAAASLANVPPEQFENFAALVNAGFPLDEVIKLFKAPDTKPLSLDQVRALVASGGATLEQQAAFYAMLNRENEIAARHRAPTQAEKPPQVPASLIEAVAQNLSLLDQLSQEDRGKVIAAIGPARLNMAKANENYPRLVKELETVTALLGDDRGRDALLTPMPGGQSEAILATFGRQTGASDYKARYDNLKAGQVFNADFLSSLKGQISDKDVAIIQSAASNLSLTQSAEEQKAELRKMYDALTRSIAEIDRMRQGVSSGATSVSVGGSMNTRAGLGNYPG